MGRIGVRGSNHKEGVCLDTEEIRRGKGDIKGGPKRITGVQARKGEGSLNAL